MNESVDRSPECFPAVRSLRLQIGREQVVLEGGAVSVVGEPPRSDAALEARLRRLQIADSGRSPLEAETELHDIGRELASAFLPPAVLAALAQALAGDCESGSEVFLGLEVSDPELELLPWETLWLPGSAQPLALTVGVFLYRYVTAPAPPRTVSAAGPLRLTVAVAHPQGAPLLDMERELARILAALEPLRRDARARVRILEQGSLAAIRWALQEEPCHILHVSCHAAPGVLLLEDATGQPDAVPAERFISALSGPGASPELIVLAGCSTADPRGRPQEDSLPGIAQELVKRGIPGVLAMRGRVSDRYATDFAARFFADLARMSQPFPAQSLAAARKSVEAERRSQIRAPQGAPEWPTPILFTSGPPAPLGVRISALAAGELPPLAEVRRGEEFVGRRGEIRWLLDGLRAPETACAVIHGIGGVGKSALAAQVLQRLTEAGWLTVTLPAPVSVEDLLHAVSEPLLSHPSTSWGAGAWLVDPEVPPQARGDRFLAEVLPQVRLAVLLDGCETRLDSEGSFRDADLRAFLSRWLNAPGLSRLVVTSRLPVAWAEEGRERVIELGLGPLSPAETAKLFWRLPGLRAQSDQILRQVYEELGGYPAALERLATRLEGRESAADLDLEPALSAVREEAVAAAGIAALIAQLPLSTGDLLSRVAVYRRPFAREGLLFQLTEGIADLEASLILPAQREEPLFIPGFVPVVIANTPLVHTHLPARDGAEPGLTAELPSTANWIEPEGFADSLRTLERFGLLYRPAARHELYLAHRWVAETLLRGFPEEPRRQAHHRGALYWRWQARRLENFEPLLCLLEARYHYRQADRIESAVAVNEWVCVQLHIWSEWEQESALCRETLSWLPDRTKATAAMEHQLGLIAHEQGAYDEARTWYERALATSKRLGDRPSEAATIHQIGVLFQAQGKFGEAEKWLHRALVLKRSLGDPAAVASTLHQLALIAELRKEIDQAESILREALAVEEEAADELGRAKTLHQLGNLELARGRSGLAEELYAQAARVFQHLGDRASFASTLHQLGLLAQRRKAYDEAFDRLHRAKDLEQAIHDRASLANTSFQLGNLALEVGSTSEATRSYREALNLYEALHDPGGIARALYQMAGVEQAQGTAGEAERLYRQSAELFAQLEVPDALAWALLRLGMILFRERRSAEGETNLQRAIDRFVEAGAFAEAKAAGRQLGNLMLQQIEGGAPKPATFPVLARVLGIAGRWGDEALATAALHVYGTSLDFQERFQDQAVEAQIGELGFGDPRYAVELARVRLLQKQYQEAIDLARTVTEQAGGKVPSTARAQALYVSGEAQLALGLESGFVDLGRGLELARKSRDKALAAEGYLRQGHARLVRQDFEDARLAYLSAASLYRKLNRPRQVALCYRFLILLSQQVGREKDVDDFRQEAIKYFQGIGHPEWLQELAPNAA